MQSRMNPKFILCVAVLLATGTFLVIPAKAQEVGTAAAVNTLSQGTPPGGGVQVLRIGARVLHNERIQTSASGTVQLLFIDKTTLSVGPSSTLVIDKFVYDPATGTGQMVTTLTRGALRFVGGQLSHQGAATVNTPVATIGIRGGTATIAHGQGGTRLINHFGRLSSANGCGTAVVRRTGFAITVADWNSCPAEPERVTEAEINKYLRLLTSKSGQKGGASSVPTEALVEQYGVGQVTGLGPDTPPVQQQTTHAENAAFDLVVQATQKGTVRVNPGPIRTSPRPPPPPPPPPPE
jgi:FecR protein